MKRIALALVGLIILAVAGAAAWIATFDANAYREPIAAEISRATGRDFAFDGKLKLELGLVPKLAVEGARLANAPWGARAQMATLRRAEVEIELLPLLKREVRVRRVLLSGLDLLLESDKSGKGNWVMGPEPAAQAESASGAAPTVAIGRIDVADLVVAYRDDVTGVTRSLRLDKATVETDPSSGAIALDLAGVIEGNALALQVATAPLADLLSMKPLPIELKGRLGDVRFSVGGKIAEPAAGKGLDLRLVLVTDDLRALGRLAKLELPALGALRVSAQLKNAEEGGYRLADLSAKLGPQDVSGEITLRPAAARPYVKAELRSEKIDLDALPASPQKPAPPRPADGRVIPPTPLGADLLPDGIDVYYRHGIKTLRVGGLDWSPVEIDLTLLGESRSGPVLTLRKGMVGRGTGRVEATARIDRDGPKLRTQIRANVAKLDLGKLLKDLQVSDLLTGGPLEAQIHLTGTGRDLRELAASLDGRVHGVVGEGRVGVQYLELLAADLARSVFSGIQAEKETALNCVVLRSTVEKGVAKLDGLLLDTQRMMVVGSGQADLGREVLDLKIEPKPKEASLLSLAFPVLIGGSFAQPSFSTDKATVAKAAAGLALTTVFGPLALLMPLAKTGTDDKLPCASAIGRADGKKPSSSGTQPRRQRQ